MSWRVVFHPAVVREDLPALDADARRRILRAIRKKLTLDPEAYGAPLRKELFGFWKLRVDGYRVIYAIRKQEIVVLIMKIGMRRDAEAYRDMAARFGSA